MGELKFKVWRLDKRKMYRVIRLSDSFYGECEEPYCHYENEEGKREFLPLSMGVILQYTGQNDKNGSEIYEGDITVATINKRLAVIRFGEYEDVFGNKQFGYYYEGEEWNYPFMADN